MQWKYLCVGKKVEGIQGKNRVEHENMKRRRDTEEVQEENEGGG